MFFFVHDIGCPLPLDYALLALLRGPGRMRGRHWARSPCCALAAAVWLLIAAAAAASGHRRCAVPQSRARCGSRALGELRLRGGMDEGLGDYDISGSGGEYRASSWRCSP